MQTQNTALADLSKTELLATLDSAWTAGNRALAKMLAYLGEVERRRLHVDMSCSSMFVFVERRFGLTGGTAFRRLTAARLVHRFPSILPRVESGDVHLEALCALRDVLTVENVDGLMAQVAKKTLREVEGIVACLAPRPDVKGSIRKMPERCTPPGSDPTMPVPTEVLAMNVPTQTSTFIASTSQSKSDSADSLFAPARLAAATAQSAIVVRPASIETAAEADVVVPKTATEAQVQMQVPAPIATRTEASRPRVQQLSGARHKVQLTVSSETRAKIERAQSLMKHRNPSGDLEVVLDRAMDALLEKLEKERLGKTSRPQKKRRPSKDGHIAAETRREVFARDGEQCAHVDEHGNRCGCRDFLELDHIVPRAKGGTDEASNLRVVCRAHNRRYAEREFGTSYIAKRIEQRRKAASGSETTRHPATAHTATSPSPDRK